MFCDRCRSNLRHRAKALLGHRKQRPNKRNRDVVVDPAAALAEGPALSTGVAVGSDVIAGPAVASGPAIRKRRSKGASFCRVAGFTLASRHWFVELMFLSLFGSC